MSCLPTAVSALAAEPRCAGRAVSTPAAAWAIGLVAALWLAGPAGAASSVVTTPQVRAELIAHAPEGVGPGKPLWLGLKIEHQPHWHTYWKNPGDSGLPTTLEWQLPAGWAAGDIEWPTPKKLPIGPLMNFGFEGTLLLPVAVQVPAGFNAGQADIKLHAEWLVCKDVCIPESGDFVLSLPAGVAACEIAWPTPKRLPVGPLVNYGYEDQLLLPVPLTVASDFKGSALDVKLTAQWLVCKDVCIPQQGEF
ncbi:MAG: hypothetical protein RLY78_1147, partial [Pseudomonadota bacterium]